KLAERLYPNNPYLENYYRVYSSILKERGSEAFNTEKYKESAIAYNYCTLVVPNDPHAWYGLGGAYYHLKRYDKAKQCWEKTLRLDSEYENARKALKDLPD
ncbi:MAG: tetratricopeptide repeat protein, partial [Bacteroidia bacterium]